MTPTNEKDIGMNGKLSGDDYDVGDLHDDVVSHGLEHRRDRRRVGQGGVVGERTSCNLWTKFPSM